MDGGLLIAAIGVAAPILGAVLMAAWRSGAKIATLETRQVEMAEQIDRVEAIVDKELTHNHGHSIKDQLEALHGNQKQVFDNQTQILELLKYVAKGKET